MANVRVVMRPGWEQTVQDMPKLMNLLSKTAWNIAARASANGAGFRTEKTIDYATREKKGGTPPLYKAKDAIFTGRKSIALVYTANYSAAKDNTLHNTLLKSK